MTTSVFLLQRNFLDIMSSVILRFNLLEQDKQ